MTTIPSQTISFATATPTITTSLSPHYAHYPQSSSHPFLSLLEKCSSSKHLKKLHALAITAAFSGFAYITSRILARYADSGEMHNAHKLFDIITSPTIFNWNTMIRGFSKSPSPEKGLFLYLKMRRNGAIDPNMHTFPFAVKACGNPLTLSQLHSHIFVFGFDLDVYVCSSLIRRYSGFGEMELADKVFVECSNKNTVCWTSLISGYCNHDVLDRARELFDEMPERSDVSWSAMVAGYVQNGRYEEAMELFLEVKVSESANLNGSLLVSVLRACSALGAFEEGRWIHSYVDDKGFEYGVELGTALLDFYAKCGLVRLSKEVFDKMPDRDVTAWSAMIGSLALNGYSHSAIQLFSDMLRSKMKPNAITFVGLLTACNHGGLVDEGMIYFRDMVNIYKISPSIEHYGCMVDLLSRAGQTKKAEEMILSMPIEPDGAIWGSLLHGCYVHGDVELAEEVGRVVLEVEPDHCGRYVGLANAYAVMGRWEGVAKVRRAMEERGVKTIAGWSLVEVNGCAHRFLANKNKHPMLHEIFRILNVLNLSMISRVDNDGILV